MSQLESILSQLKKSLEAQGVDVSGKSLSAKEAVAEVDPKASSQALKDFLAKNLVAGKAAITGEEEDPKIILERRKSISNFVGTPLTNNGVASLPGTISGESKNKKESSGEKHSHSSHGSSSHSGSEKTNSTPPVPFTPPPMPVVQICPSCVAAEVTKKSKKEEEKLAEPASTVKTEAEKPVAAVPANSPIAAPIAPAPKSSPTGSDLSSSGFSASFAPTRPVTQAEDHQFTVAPKGPATATATLAPEPEQADKKGASKAGGVVALFAGLMSKAKSNNQQETGSAPTATAPAQKAVSAIAWFKHIQAVESALLIGDVHFADSILQLLYESARSVSAETNILARLQSLQAKVMIERRQFEQAEKDLKETIQNLESTPYARNVATAYCWKALALCYHRQKNSEAESANKKAIEIAEAALGAKDPEAMLFREPLS